MKADTKTKTKTLWHLVSFFVCDNDFDNLNFQFPLCTKDPFSKRYFFVKYQWPQEILTGDNIFKSCAVVNIEHFSKTTSFGIFYKEDITHGSILSHPFSIQHRLKKILKRKNLLREIFKTSGFILRISYEKIHIFLSPSKKPVTSYIKCQTIVI